MFDLKGKTALITGSGQGIGKSTALLLAKQGAKVIINWRSNDEVAAKTIEELKSQGADFLTWKYDLSKPTVKADFEAFMKENDITVDILVLNASVQIRNAWENIPVEEFDFQMRVNLYATLALIQACVPGMREKHWGRIVTIGSVQQYRPNTAMAVYAASKAGLIALAKSIAQEMGSRGIRANAIAPGFIETAMTAALPEEVRKEWCQKIPLRRGGQVEDIANVALFLASDLSSYVSGQVIQVDGGMNM